MPIHCYYKILPQLSAYHNEMMLDSTRLIDSYQFEEIFKYYEAIP